MACAMRRWGVLRLAALILILCGFSPAHADTQDVTSQFSITRSGLVFNRTTATYDSTVTVKNVSGAPVLGAINAAISGLPANVTLANQAGQTPEGKPFVTPLAAGAQLQNGATLSFVLKFANPQNVAFTSIVQMLYTVVVPAGAPSLISVTASGGVNALVIGRVDGLANRSIAVQTLTAPACFMGTLVGGAPAGGVVTASTDAMGYFAASVSGVNPGAYVAVKMTAPSQSAVSTCLVSSRDNDSWNKAFPLSGATLTAQDFIDAPGKARWYRVDIQPAQTLRIALTNPATDFDLAVFKDIAQAFNTQFDPAKAGTGDLVKLAAEYAPSIFSPSIFSPSIFSPDAYSPSIFSPSIFSPSIFSPSIFSPSIFSPSIFSPSIFSPSIFSPSIFSPSIFSPSIFSPSIFSPAEVAQAFSTAQTRSVIAVAATPGPSGESTIVNTWNSTGNFYIRVTGHGSAFNTSQPFTLNVVKSGTTCSGVTDLVLAPRARVPAAGYTTVMVTDSSVLGLDDPLQAEGGGTLRGKLTDLAARPEVKGVLVDIASDARVTALKQQAAANPACPFAKNLVAEEIKNIVDTYRGNPLKYVLILGNDNAVPFFRSPDQSGLGQESGYVPPVQSNSSSEASLRRDFVLSQDRYGSTSTLSLGASQVAVPGLAVGRLVETPAEIVGMLDAYVAVDGIVVPRTSLVTGYDFLADAAASVKTELELGTSATVDSLITPNGVSPQDSRSWTATQLGQKLLGTRHDVVFLAGHFSANSALAADFTTSLLSNDLAVSKVDLANAIVFSAGCHSGYNLVDRDAIPGVTYPLDWAQAFARKQATLIAGTGYQYGDTDFLLYSEMIYRNLARALRAGTGPVAIGEALVHAKLDYLAITPEVRGIPEKSLAEATLFGLPMLRVNMPAGRGAAPGTSPVINAVPVASGPASTLHLKTFDLTVAPSLTSQSRTLNNVASGGTVLASWMAGADGVVSRPGEPVLPLLAVNVTPTDSSVVLRGVGFRGGTYVDSAPLLPFSAAPATELRSVHVPFVSPVFYPSRLWNANYFGALAGSGGTQLLLTPAQHRVANAAQGLSTQRRFTGLNFRLFYSGDLSKAALSEAPSIMAVDARTQAGANVFSVQVTGDPAAAVHQVWVTYASAGSSTWASLDLAQCVAPLPVTCQVEDSRLWMGRLANAPVGLKYMVQAASGIGLVALDDNRGAYFDVNSPTPTSTTLAVVGAPSSAVVGDSIDVKLKLAFGGSGLAGKTVILALGGIGQVGTTASDGTVTLHVPVGATPGTYALTAFFGGDDTFQPTSISTSFQVNKAAASLAALSPAGVALTGAVAGKTQALQLEAVSFAVTGPSGPLTIFASTDELGRALLPPPGLESGTYTVASASFAGNNTFSATSVALSQTFNVAKLAQALTFDPIADTAFVNQPVAAFAASSAGLPVVLTGSGACTVSGNYVQVTGVGACTVTASQGGDPVYANATAVSRTFNVTKANQAITFGPAPTGVTVGQPLVMVLATSSSPSAGPSTTPIALTTLTPSVCSVAGVNAGLVNALATGTCTIAANQGGDALYNAAPQATLSFAVSPAGTGPQTFTVTNLNDSGAGSLRAAIAAANASPGPDIVDFQAGLTGTIVLTSGNIVVSGPVSINGPGAASLTVDGNATNRIFAVGVTFPACPATDGPDYLVAISGLRLTNGRRLPAGSVGGAIYSEHSLMLDSMVIDHNIARSGGGLAFAPQYAGQTLTITNSQFLDNAATELVPPPQNPPSGSEGGALTIVEKCQNPNPFDVPHTEPVTVTIAGSSFLRNLSQPTKLHGRGGAIRSWSLADLTITDTSFVDNHVDAPNPPGPGLSYHGGAIAGSFKSVRIERSEISQNTATDVTGADVTRSGGLHLHKESVDRQGPGDVMRVKIVDSTISSNQSSATAGAMVAFGNVALELVNSTIANNIAAPTRTGGVIMSSGGTYPVTGYNTAQPSLVLTSTILANNSSTGGDVATNRATIPSFAVVANQSLVRTLCAPCFLSVAGNGNLIGVDPLLGVLANNGGPTRTHALLGGSPAIDKGSNPLGLATDQRGTGFPRVSGAAADMGAHESP